MAEIATLRTKRLHSLTGLAHSLLWPLIAVLLLGWVVELIGLSGLQHNCSDDTFVSSPLFATNTQLPSGLVCRQVYRWLWWTWVLQLPAFLGVVITAGMQVAHPGAWVGVVGLLSTVSVMQMWCVNVTLNIKDALYYGEGLMYARTAFAGFLIASFADLMLMLAIGFASSLSFHAHEHGVGQKVVIEPATVPVHTGGAAAIV
jgi:hypothetical protein